MLFGSGIKQAVLGSSFFKISANLRCSAVELVWYGTATCGFVNLAISKPVSGEALGAMPTVQKTTSNFSL
jgi:hypothetical protein